MLLILLTINVISLLVLIYIILLGIRLWNALYIVKYKLDQLVINVNEGFILVGNNVNFHSIAIEALNISLQYMEQTIQSTPFLSDIYNKIKNPTENGELPN